MPSQLFLKLQVTLVKNPSLIIERTMITLKNEQFPEIYELFANVDAFFISIIIHVEISLIINSKLMKIE